MAASNNLISYELNGVKESFANWVSNISPADTPFTSLTGKESITNKYFQWQTDALNPVAANAVAEGSSATDAEVKLNPTTILKNVTQILRKVVKVSDTADALSSWGRGSELQYQMEKAAKELKRDLEYAFLNQKTQQDAVPPGQATSAANVRKFGGFPFLVAAKDAASPENAGAVVHKAAAAAMPTEAEVFDITAGLYLAGAKASHIMFHPTLAKFFTSLRESNTGTRKLMFDGSVSQKINAYVNTVVDPLGQEFTLVPNRFMPKDAIYFFSPSDWTQMVLRAPSRIQLAKDGSYEKWMIEMEVGLRHRNPFASGILELPAGSTGGGSGGTNPPAAPTITGTGVVKDATDSTGHTYTVAVTGTGTVPVVIAPAQSSAVVLKTTPALDTTKATVTALTPNGFTVTGVAAGTTTAVVTIGTEDYTFKITVATA